MTIWKLKFLPSFSKFITLCSNVQECNNTRIYAKCYAGAKIERFLFLSLSLFLPRQNKFFISRRCKNRDSSFFAPKDTSWSRRLAGASPCAPVGAEFLMFCGFLRTTIYALLSDVNNNQPSPSARRRH